MRKLCFVLCVLLMPLPAIAQQRFSLPPIGLPLPPIGLPPAPAGPVHGPFMNRNQFPIWERNRLPPWEKGVRRPFAGDFVRQRQRHFRQNGLVYFWPTFWGGYPYEPYAPPEPQVIVVQQPQPIVIEVPVPQLQTPPPAPPPAAPDPPYVPTGDRTVYIIPGCYVGNVPPDNVKLPATCDITKLTTFHPGSSNR